MIKTWLKNNFIEYTDISKNRFEINGVGEFLFITDRERVLDDDMNLIFYEDEILEKVDYYCFKWGENIYYSKTRKIHQFDLLKYIGNFNDKLDFGNYPFLGIHGGYDILDGSKSYQDWIKKAKFLNINTLGICERNTLGGVLKFQLACENNGLNFLIGEEIIVKDNDKLYRLKLFVKNNKGWKNLLFINKEINVINSGNFIESRKLIKLLDDLIVVLDPKYIPFSRIIGYELQIDKDNLYYQLDTVIYENNEQDEWYLNNLKEFIQNRDLNPVLITDAYYLDKQDYKTKQILNTISGVRGYESKNQYFKTLYENFEILNSLFKNDDNDNFLSLFQKSIENIRVIESECIRFKIQTGIWHFPKYKMNEGEEEKYKGNIKNLFLDLIDKGLKERVPRGKFEEYKKRVEKEYLVIVDGGIIDYFIILWDIIKWAKKQDILIGIARGSSGGSIISYLLSITELDSIKYGLLFERFLSKDRIKAGTMPDIDVDFQASRRDEVKKYIEEKYGINQVCSVGTYTNFKLKAAFKDVSRLNNISFDIANYISQILDIEDGRWYDIFKTATLKQQVKEFIIKYPQVVEDMNLILNQPKSRSIHACAILILPDNKSMYEWIPIRVEHKDDEDILVSEWEGKELEKAGFLKEDILGIKQLDKYKFILDLIKEFNNEEINIYDIPLNVNGIYDLFGKGYNGDVFHFGSKGLSSYCKELKPKNIEDLIAGISLYRPGAIENNFHNEYILRKEGKREIIYWTGAENVLDKTYAVIVYQEQIMKLCQVLGGLSLVEADDVRRAMVKKEYEALHKYKERFILYYIENFGVSEKYSINVWGVIEKASLYLFNRAHAAAYAIMGYISQWLKYNYPLQYWTSAFQFDDSNPKKSNISRFISEIKKTNNFIKIMPPHINESKDVFTSNPKKMELYWSIIKIKQLGGKALEAILNERDENGEFFSLEDFLGRVDKRVINKAVVINLILSGSFDDLEGIVVANDRKVLINKYYEFTGIKRVKDDVYLGVHEDYWWQIKQKELCGFGFIDYVKILRDKTELKFRNYKELSVIDSIIENKEFIVAGIIKSFVIRITKNGNEFCRIVIDSNDDEIEITLWSDVFEGILKKEVIIGKIIAMNGKVIDDNYKHQKVIHNFEKSKIYFI